MSQMVCKIKDFIDKWYRRIFLNAKVPDTLSFGEWEDLLIERKSLERELREMQGEAEDYQMAEENTTDDGGVEKYSFRGKNKDGIEVYETSEHVKSLSWKERKKLFLQLMRNQYRGRTAKFVRNGHAYYATFEYRDVSKNIYGDTASDPKGRDAKVNVGADGNIFELVEHSEYFLSEAERGKTQRMHRGVKYWDYFIKTVQIDGDVYDVLAHIRKKDSGNFVYDIEMYQNKKIEPSSPEDSLESGRNGMPNSSNTIIRNGNGVVKNESAESVDVEVDAKTEAEIAEEQVEQADRDLEAEVKYSEREGNGFRQTSYQEWDVQSALYDALDHADKGDDNLIRVGNMPQFIVDKIGIEGDFYIYRNHAYENMVSSEQAKKDGRFSVKAHYHDLGIEKMTDAVMALENPIMTIATKTKDGNPAVIMILPVAGKNKAPLYAVLSFYSDRKINGDYSRKPHIVLTIAERDYFGSDARKGHAEIVRQAVKDNRVIDFDKKMRDSLSVIANQARVGDITDASLTANLAYFRKEIKAFKEENKISYSDRDTESVSNRSLLANAFEGVAQTDWEKQKLQEYKGKIELIEAEERKLQELREQIKELSFAKGPRDKAKITALRDEATKTANRISIYDKQLLRLEASKPLQAVLEREKKKAYQRAEQKGKEALAEYRESPGGHVQDLQLHGHPDAR